MTDASLILGWSKGKPLGPTKSALSVSSVKQLREDPWRWAARKVLKVSEPPTIALAQGSAFHDGIEILLATGDIKAAIEDFDRTLEKQFKRIPNPTGRLNWEDPINPRDKTDKPFSLEEARAQAMAVVLPVYNMLLSAAHRGFPGVDIQRDNPVIEATVGELAQRTGMPSAMARLFDPRVMKTRDTRVAVLNGVPVHGFVDVAGTIPEYSNMYGGHLAVLDHKLVTHAVSYYPPRWGNKPWTCYGPNYDPETDLQLDVYTGATNASVAGFQYLTKAPQYVNPETKTLMPNWVPYEDYNGMGLPGLFMGTEEGLRYACVLRPPMDPAIPRKRAAKILRETAEFLTEGLTLYMEGVDLEIAFPPGPADKIARKSCPFCSLNGSDGLGACPSPRSPKDNGYEEDAARREEACWQSKGVRSLREAWVDREPTP